ncbi:MAG: PDZ domain-containing protein [Sphingobacteriaceae bacterium]|nr:MAG: PDZ domain-containing protein [Sphingobacteriaceae bacterium]
MSLLCVGLINQLNAQYFELDSNRKRISLPFKLVRNMVVVEASINNKGPFNFILDTGVGLMLITDPTLVDSLQINNKRTVKVAGLGEGGDAEAFITSPLAVNISNIKSYNVAAAILKKDHFSLSNFLGMQVHGLLGYEFFSRLAVQVNFADSTLSISRPTDLRVFKKGERISISIEERKPYVTTKITMPDGTVSYKKLIIDLGAGHPVSLENLIRSKGLPEKFIAANLGIGLNGPISGFISRIKQLNIGSFNIKGPLTSFPDDSNTTLKLAVARDGNLGTGILKRFNVIFDYYNGAMYLKKNKNYKMPFEHDMSGLEYFAGGKDHKHIIISRVEPGSPAYNLGLEKYDEIVTINFKPVAKMTLEEIDDLFRSKDGRNLLLEVYHDKKYDNVILTLKRRI